MKVEDKMELRGILLVSLFIVVVPLIFFPKDFGLTWGASPLLHFIIEIIWYALILSLILPKPSARQVIIYAILNWGYRMILGGGFAILLMVMLSQSFSSALALGVYQYTPAFILQVLMSPFVLKSLLGGFMKKNKKAEQELFELQKNTPEPFSSTPPKGRILADKSMGRGSLVGEKELKTARADNLECILHYIKEYSGVKAVILVDNEGLVVAQEASTDQDAETIASYARCLKEANDQVLEKIGEKSSERINIHTPALWISLNQIGRFILVVVADRCTGELLSVRIMQSLVTIKRFLTERYQENILKAVEG